MTEETKKPVQERPVGKEREASRTEIVNVALDEARNSAEAFERKVTEDEQTLETRYGAPLTPDEKAEVERLKQGVTEDLAKLNQEIKAAFAPPKEEDPRKKYKEMTDAQLDAEYERLFAATEADIQAHPEKLKAYKKALKTGKEPVDSEPPATDINLVFEEIRNRRAGLRRQPLTPQKPAILPTPVQKPEPPKPLQPLRPFEPLDPAKQPKTSEEPGPPSIFIGDVNLAVTKVQELPKLMNMPGRDNTFEEFSAEHRVKTAPGIVQLRPDLDAVGPEVPASATGPKEFVDAIPTKALSKKTPKPEPEKGPAGEGIRVENKKDDIQALGDQIVDGFISEALETYTGKFQDKKVDKEYVVKGLRDMASSLEKDQSELLAVSDYATAEDLNKIRAGGGFTPEQQARALEVVRDLLSQAEANTVMGTETPEEKATRSERLKVLKAEQAAAAEKRRGEILTRVRENLDFYDRNSEKIVRADLISRLGSGGGLQQKLEEAREWYEQVTKGVYGAEIANITGLTDENEIELIGREETSKIKARIGEIKRKRFEIAKEKIDKAKKGEDWTQENKPGEVPGGQAAPEKSAEAKLAHKAVTDKLLDYFNEKEQKMKWRVRDDVARSSLEDAEAYVEELRKFREELKTKEGHHQELSRRIKLTDAEIDTLDDHDFDKSRKLLDKLYDVAISIGEEELAKKRQGATPEAAVAPVEVAAAPSPETPAPTPTTETETPQFDASKIAERLLEQNQKSGKYKKLLKGFKPEKSNVGAREFLDSLVEMGFLTSDVSKKMFVDKVPAVVGLIGEVKKELARRAAEPKS